MQFFVDSVMVILAQNLRFCTMIITPNLLKEARDKRKLPFSPLSSLIFSYVDSDDWDHQQNNQNQNDNQKT